METSRTRSVLKAFTWRLVASLDTFTLGFLITGHAAAAASIAGGEVLTKMVLYYLHERGWAAVDWGHRASRLEADEQTISYRASLVGRPLRDPLYGVDFR